VSSSGYSKAVAREAEGAEAAAAAAAGTLAVVEGAKASKARKVRYPERRPPKELRGARSRREGGDKGKK